MKNNRSSESWLSAIEQCIDKWRVSAHDLNYIRRHLAKENDMSAHTYKIIELVGSSCESSDDAIRNAIAKASATVRHMNWFEVVETRGHIVDGKVAHFQVTLKVGFRLEE
jgi:flavin-binding protein dodecin